MKKVINTIVLLVFLLLIGCDTDQENTDSQPTIEQVATSEIEDGISTEPTTVIQVELDETNQELEVIDNDTSISAGDASVGFTLADDWRLIDFDEPFITESFDQVAENNPQLQALFTEERLALYASQGYKLLAINLNTKYLVMETQPTINAIVTNFTGTPNQDIVFDQFVDLNKAELENSLGITSIAEESTTIDGFPAEILSYKVTGTNTKGETVTANNRQYFVETAPGTFWVITLSYPTEAIEDAPTFIEQVETLQFGR